MRLDVGFNILNALLLRRNNVEAADALTGLRSWDATLDRIRTGWERLPLHLEDPAWSGDQSGQLWRRDC